MIDIVIPLGSGTRWHDNEIRYCLRSLAVNFIDLGAVFIVGEKPKWMKNVVHIKAKDTLPENKDGNIINKVLLACEHPDLSMDFIRLSDDQIILQPMRFIDIRPYFLDDLADRPSVWWQGGKWKRRMKHTFELLRKQKKTTYHYDSHIPMPCNKYLFRDVFEKVDYEKKPGVTINTWYFNNIGLEDHQKLMDQKAGFEMPAINIPIIWEKIKDKYYLSYNDGGLNDYLKAVIMTTFPYKSKFEI